MQPVDELATHVRAVAGRLGAEATVRVVRSVRLAGLVAAFAGEKAGFQLGAEQTRVRAAAAGEHVAGRGDDVGAVQVHQTDWPPL